MKHPIKILSPSRSYAMTKAQIEAGADEIYLGVDYGDYDLFSFGGRYKRINNTRTQLTGMEELQKNAKYCKEHGVTLQVTANMHYIPPEFEDEYLEFVKECVQCGVDQIIISNIGLLKRVAALDLPVQLVAGSFTFIPNSEMVKYLRSLGAMRVVLPHAATIQEIETVKNACPDMELEIFALMGGGNNCGRCMMFHSPVRKDIGPGCRAHYDVVYDGESYPGANILDAAADCSLCSMRDLIRAGADSLKIVGREAKNEKVASKFTEVFYQYRQGVEAGLTDAEIKNQLSKHELAWELIWKKRFCENKKCKFHKTEVVASYI